MGLTTQKTGPRTRKTGLATRKSGPGTEKTGPETGKTDKNRQKRAEKWVWRPQNGSGDPENGLATRKWGSDDPKCGPGRPGSRFFHKKMNKIGSKSKKSSEGAAGGDPSRARVPEAWAREGGFGPPGPPRRGLPGPASGRVVSARHHLWDGPPWGGQTTPGRPPTRDPPG